MDLVSITILIAVVILLAYIVAQVDIYYIHRKAQRNSERNRIIELLKRKWLL